MSPKKIVIDTDCGVDDAVAIMIALSSAEELAVLGVTTVSGNVPLEHVLDNVLRLLTFLDRTEIPVYRGASMPLVERPRHATDIHGFNGLGDVELPPPRMSEQAARAPEGIVRLARENPGLTLLTLGPLSNVAIALNLYPELLGLIGEIVIMGGGIETGNVTPFAEFNFYADPESVQFVIDSGIPLSVLTWDATLTVVHTEEELAAAGFGSSASGRLFLDLQRLPFIFFEKRSGKRATMLPDPLTAAYLVDRGIARRTLTSGLRMELDRGERRGASVLADGKPSNIVVDVDKPGFMRILSRVIGLKP
jgi:inosine-uridine nucleoside N-ribohydrolase